MKSGLCELYGCAGMGTWDFEEDGTAAGLRMLCDGFGMPLIIGLFARR